MKKNRIRLFLCIFSRKIALIWLFYWSLQLLDHQWWLTIHQFSVKIPNHKLWIITLKSDLGYLLMKYLPEFSIPFCLKTKTNFRRSKTIDLRLCSKYERQNSVFLILKSNIDWIKEKTKHSPGLKIQQRNEPQLNSNRFLAKSKRLFIAFFSFFEKKILCFIDPRLERTVGCESNWLAMKGKLTLYER